MAIDIRELLASFLEEYGHDIVYVRRDTRFHCSCYSDRSKEAQPNCPKCFGTGYHVTLETYKARRQISSIPETHVGARELHGAGSVTVKGYTYYLEYKAFPKSGDLILEVEWDENIPKKIIEKFEISIAEELKGKNGRIEFYQVYCRTDLKGGRDNEALSSS